jgi:uncharacterized protein YdaU (DUF1376 family)
MARKPDSHHVLPLWCDDLIASCVDMTPACFGAYMRLLCYAWTRGGIPDDQAACDRIAGGMDPGDWEAIRSRLAVTDDGRLTHERLELERLAVAEIREERSRAGRAGGNARARNLANGKQTASKPVANDLANGKQTPSKSVAPNPSPSLPIREETHTHTPATEPVHSFGESGWADDEWQQFAAVWNVTERAEPWPHLTAPDGWVDLAATPGWLQRAREALARLPSRQYFDRPLPVTRFFDFVDRIRAGEFADPKGNARTRGRQPAGGNL